MNNLNGIEKSVSHVGSHSAQEKEVEAPSRQSQPNLPMRFNSLGRSLRSSMVKELSAKLERENVEQVQKRDVKTPTCKRWHNNSTAVVLYNVVCPLAKIFGCLCGGYCIASSIFMCICNVAIF